MLEILVKQVSLHPSSFFLHQIYLTFYRFVKVKEITDLDILENEVMLVLKVVDYFESDLQRFVNLDPSSVYTVFLIQWFYENDIIDSSTYSSFLVKCCEYSFSVVFLKLIYY